MIGNSPEVRELWTRCGGSGGRSGLRLLDKDVTMAQPGFLKGDFSLRTEAALEALRAGRPVLLTDDEDRENEGDIICSAEKMTVPDMALMIRECSGIVCLCLTEEKARTLDLEPMVQKNTSRHRTPFTVSVEAREGVTTGVSASDRIATIRAATAPGARPEDLARPGHVFPLLARPGGVFERQGHTEGSVDLVRLAGLAPAAVLCELTNPDGSMAKLPEILKFSEKHKMPIVSIQDIVAYRKAREASKNE